MGLKKSKLSVFSIFKKSKAANSYIQKDAPLSSLDLSKLMAMTKFTREECIEWHKKFRQESVNGVFDKKTFIKFYTQLNPEFKDADEFAANVFDCKFFYCLL